MSPKVITGEVFRNRKELPNEVVENLVVDGGVERIKAMIQERWGYAAEEPVVLPCLTLNTDGKISGAKWHTLGLLRREVNLKLCQLNPDADEDIFLCLRNLDLSVFPFYNKRRNVSGWIDSNALEYAVFRKVKSKKQTVTSDQYQAVGFKGFSVRIGVLPVSVNAANLIVAVHPMSKEQLKQKAPDCYYKNSCPQVALPIGENNAKQLTVKLGIEEPASALTGLGVYPIIEDLRGAEESAIRPSSWEIRVALHGFIRSCKGFNSKSAKKTLEAMEEVAVEAAKEFEPEFVWQEHAAAEGEEPEVELGKWQTYCTDNRISLQ